MLRLLAALFMLALCPQLLFCAELDMRKPIISGACPKPYPALPALDYPLCRAEAWLAALDIALKKLPPYLNARFRQAGIDSRLGKLAFCALLFPPDITTPENAPGDSVRVFLHWPPNLTKEAERILSDVWELYQEMALLWETIQAIRELRLNWPQSARQEPDKLDTLTSLSDLLRALWDTQNPLTLHSKEGLAPNPASAAICLKSGKNRQNLPANLLDATLATLLYREANDPENSVLWNRLISQTLYLRGLSHEKLGQPALAETDFSAALARLEKTGPIDSFAASIYLARGNIKRQAHNQDMCQDYGAACGLGKCEALSLARRRGECLEL